MVMTILFMSTFAVLSFSLMAMVNWSHKEQRGSFEELSALYVCEAGIAAAVADMDAGGTGTLGSAQNPVPFGSASYHVTATDLGQGRTSLLAVGEDDGSSLTIRVVVEAQGSSLYQWAAFGDEGLTMASNAMVDSYDSSAGSYEDQEVNGAGNDTYANENGNIGTNGDITLSSNNEVHGDATPGETGTFNGDSTNVSGSTSSASTSVELPPIVLPSLASSGALVISGTGTIPSGEVRYDSLDVTNNSVLTITGPATIVTTDFVLNANSKIVVDATAGPVTFYVENDFLVNSNGLISSTTYDPADVTFNLLSDNIIDPDTTVDLDDVAFDSNTEIYGTIYAPEAHISIESNFELFGGLVARSVHLASNSKIHYDENLRTQGMTSGQSSYQTLCWLLEERN